MLEELSPHQASLLPRWRDDWIGHGLSTAPADREAAEAGVDMAYRAASLEPPRIRIWLGSPYQGAIGAALLIGRDFSLASDVPERLWLRPEVVALVLAQMPDQLQLPARFRDLGSNGIDESIRDHLHRQLTDRAIDQVRTKVGIQIWGQVQDQIMHPITDQIRNPINNQIRDAIWIQFCYFGQSRHVQSCYNGQFGAGWLGCFDYFDRVVGIRETEPLRGLVQVARSCGCWWPFRDVVILTDRPETLRRDTEGRLHETGGMALRYRDGWGIHAVHGVRVPAHVVEAPESITPKTIEAEANAEIRRVMIERYKPGAEIGGAAAYLLDSGALEIDRAADVTKDPIVLYRKDVAGDEPILMLAMKNATPEPDGRVRDYFLRVPPEMTSAVEAMAWTFGLAGRDYRPDIET